MNKVETLAAGIKDAFVSALPDNLNDEVRSSIEETYEPLSLSIAESIQSYMTESMEEYVDQRLQELTLGSSVEVDLTADKLREAFSAFSIPNPILDLWDGRNSHRYTIQNQNILFEMMADSDVVVKLEGEMK